MHILNYLLVCIISDIFISSHIDFLYYYSYHPDVSSLDIFFLLL